MTNDEIYNELITEKMASARLGIETETFLATDTGKRILACAQAEYNAALLQLAEVDPLDSGAIMRLQAQAWRADSVQGWLENIINSGREAEVEIRAMEGRE